MLRKKDKEHFKNTIKPVFSNNSTIETVIWILISAAILVFLILIIIYFINKSQPKEVVPK